jgi:signal peptidase II
MPLPRRAVIFVAMLIVTLALDQGSKAWARTLPVEPADCSFADLAAHTCRGVPQPVISGSWDWQLAMNDGAAFSSFRGSRVVLTLLAFAALIMIGMMAKRTKPEQRLQRIAYAMIAGGALGNLVDRLRDGAVTDFVRWLNDMSGPFNVADVRMVGVGCPLRVRTAIPLHESRALDHGRDVRRAVRQRATQKSWSRLRELLGRRPTIPPPT